uniref:Solute carrier family 40 protein n=1 Tax=Heterorhabditis bacteriophora TaxID=37862 RepID=A0A1I7WT56_HETBA
MWQMIAGFATTGQGGSTDRTVLKYQMMITGIKFLIGATITASIMVAVLTERAAFLMPYLLLQGAGLAAGMVFFVSFLYISLFGDRSTAVAFLRSQGHPMPKSPNHNYLSEDTFLTNPNWRNVAFYYARINAWLKFKTDDIVSGYFSWLMTGSFAIIIILQIWLMGIVIACWRYLRDKRAWGADVREYSPYLILRPVTKVALKFSLKNDSYFNQLCISVIFLSCNRPVHLNLSREMGKENEISNLFSNVDQFAPAAVNGSLFLNNVRIMMFL